MSYQYKGNQTYAQEIAAAQAEAEARKADAAEAARQLREIKAARRKAAEFAARHESVQREIELLTGGVQLPPPIHGGRRGLEAAAAEAHGWWTRKQSKSVDA